MGEGGDKQKDLMSAPCGVASGRTPKGRWLPLGGGFGEVQRQGEGGESLPLPWAPAAKVALVGGHSREARVSAATARLATHGHRSHALPPPALAASGPCEYLSRF